MEHLDKEIAFPEFYAAVDRKKMSPDKTILQEVSPTIQECYEQYEQKFDENCLQDLSPLEACSTCKTALIGLYSSKSTLIQNFRRNFFEINSQSYNGLCPYCALNESNTIEHILPKEIFPEYAINVLNLIPCCGECNSYKGERYTNSDGERMILNFYTDDVFRDQFLFMRFTRKEYGLSMEYYLEKPGTMTDSQFAIIQRHFNALHLINDKDKLPRYDTKAIQTFSDLKSEYSIENFQSEEKYDLFAGKQLSRCVILGQTYGVNYWSVVMRKAAATSDVFKDYILNR